MLGDAVLERKNPRCSFQELVSYVCTHWRAVALATPQLWTRLDFAHRGWDRELEWLIRSKHSPLDIHLPEVSSKTFARLLAHVQPHLHRTRSLCLEPAALEEIHSIVSMVPDENSIEVLQFRRYGDYPDPELDDQPPFSLSNVILPRLRELRVDIPFDSKPSPIATLTKLRLGNFALSGVRPSKLDELFHTVAPTLEWLYLDCEDHELGVDVFEYATVSNPTPFPRLHTLEVSETYSEFIHHLLCHYTFPVLNTLYFGVWNESTDLDLYRFLSGTIPRPTSTARNPFGAKDSRDRRINDRLSKPTPYIPFSTVEVLIWVAPTDDIPQRAVKAMMERAFPSLKELIFTEDPEASSLNAVYSGLKKGSPQLTTLRLEVKDCGELGRFIKERAKSRGLSNIDTVQVPKAIRSELMEWLVENVPNVHVWDNKEHSLYANSDSDSDERSSIVEGNPLSELD